MAEAISLRFKDVLEYHPTKDMFIESLGQFSVGSLEELRDLNLHDFGIFLELEPDENEKQMLHQRPAGPATLDTVCRHEPRVAHEPR